MMELAALALVAGVLSGFVHAALVIRRRRRGAKRRAQIRLHIDNERNMPCRSRLPR